MAVMAARVTGTGRHREKKKPGSLGAKLAELRKARGLSQDEFGARVGLSQRMVTYYETQGGNPPADLLPKFAEILGVTIDELFARKTRRAPKTEAPRNLRLWRRLRAIESLPADERKAILKVLESLLDRHKIEGEG
jgi:transcriptional regulator with XRE-family HTH domain